MESRIRRKEIDITIDISEHTTVAETDFNVNGIIRLMALTVPALTGTVTVTLKLEDEDDIEMFSQATIAESATTVIQTWNSVNLQIPVCETTTAQVTASGAQADTDKDLVLTIWYEEY